MFSGTFGAAYDFESVLRAAVVINADEIQIVGDGVPTIEEQDGGTHPLRKDSDDDSIGVPTIDGARFRGG